MEPNKTEQIIKTERPNSFVFRYGKTDTSIKIYFNDEQDLLTQIQKLEEISQKIDASINIIKENFQEKEK